MSRSEPDRLLRQLTSVRRKKVERIKSRINSGKYKVSTWDLARALFLARSSP
ncbi:MAG: flagellar biosynthesis anti-sigma factor FlgM [Proteobacteria bacterium]|nr:flagellar biosynthesis anti-sigma factor FlgM [Pseudomonadota bacterium]